MLTACVFTYFNTPLPDSYRLQNVLVTCAFIDIDAAVKLHISHTLNVCVCVGRELTRDAVERALNEQVAGAKHSIRMLGGMPRVCVAVCACYFTGVVLEDEANLMSNTYTQHTIQLSHNTQVCWTPAIWS